MFADVFSVVYSQDVAKGDNVKLSTEICQFHVTC